MSDEIVADVETVSAVAVMEEAVSADVLTVIALINGGKTGLTFNPATVERSDSVETYPIEANPVTVERRFGEDKKPAVLNCLCKLPVVESKLKEET